MLFRVSCELEYDIRFPSTLILNVHAQRNPSQIVLQEEFVTEPEVRLGEFIAEGTENRFIRLETGRHQKLAVSYSATVDCDFQTYKARSVEATPVSELNSATIPYLFPSRYCQSDRLSRLAWDL